MKACASSCGNSEGLLKLQKGLEKISPFRAKVYRALCQVPAGYVTTYHELGRQVGCKSNQAVGQALRHNPFAPFVPCHRVVKSDGNLGGFGGCRSGPKIKKKMLLLEEEGVVFVPKFSKRKAAGVQNGLGGSTSQTTAAALVSRDCFYKFP